MIGAAMCGRFTLTRRDGNSLAGELGVPPESLAGWRPRYNIAPLQLHFVVAAEFERRKAIPARWGLVNRWAKDAGQASKCINARCETLESRPAFRDAFRKRRCVIPADGFFEWTGPKSARRPLWFHREDGGLLLFAGLHEAWQASPGQWETTFTIITTSANAAIAPYHDRMPVILGDSAADEWIDPTGPDPLALKHLLAPAPDDLLAARAVSPKVNSSKIDSPELLEALS
jgi:putative SOS response-associated peptidase YedK